MYANILITAISRLPSISDNKNNTKASMLTGSTSPYPPGRIDANKSSGMHLTSAMDIPVN